jgi:hypothetical protein
LLVVSSVFGPAARSEGSSMSVPSIFDVRDCARERLAWLHSCERDTRGLRARWDVRVAAASKWRSKLGCDVTSTPLKKSVCKVPVSSNMYRCVDMSTRRHVGCRRASKIVMSCDTCGQRNSSELYACTHRIHNTALVRRRAQFGEQQTGTLERIHDLIVFLVQEGRQR